MQSPRRVLWIVTLTFFCIQIRPLQAGPFPLLFRKSRSENWERLQAAAQIPLERIAPTYRTKIDQVLAKPTVYTKGPAERFVCRPEMYRWLLDNPDRAVTAWKRLGAKCLEIKHRGNGFFGWSDGQGSDVVWHTVVFGPKLRIWYAEGDVKPSNLLPVVPVKCVVLLRHEIVEQKQRAAVMEHQADVFVYTDSRTAALVLRMLGPSVPRLAKQGAEQLQMFFAAMSWYCHQHPDRAGALLRRETVDSSSTSKSPESFRPNGMVYPAIFSDLAP